MKFETHGLIFKKLNTSNEIDEILKHQADCYAKTLVDFGEFSNLDSAKESAKKAIYNSNNELYFNIYNDDKHVGYLSYELRENGTNLFIQYLFIFEIYRKQGIGTQVLKFLDKEAAKLKIEKCSLQVHIGNESAIQCYKKNNYEITKSLNFFKTAKDTRYEMVKRVYTWKYSMRLV